MKWGQMVGAPECDAGAQSSLWPLNRELPSAYIPHAHTVGRGATGRRFRAYAICLFGVMLIGLALYPQRTFAVLLSLFTALICTQALLRFAAILCTKSRFEIRPSVNPLARTGARDWPRYTVLVPLKDEAHMVRGLITNLSKLDYPKTQLQIIFITEEDDPKTRRAVTAALRAPIKPVFEQVVVPRRGAVGPRTKPHALNIAMQSAHGEIVTIYDAEDAPSPQQLKTAVLAFEKNPSWGALQAPLDYHNTGQSWLTTQFGLEYAAQFHVWIPLMVRLGLPFPLGGTSNHIRRSALEDIRHKTLYWDSYNVTEDADLSFRLSASGWNIGYITPPTQEEAVGSLKPWTHQRTRWVKGFMQSWRVHMDRPLLPGGWRGVSRQLTLQLTLGSVILAGLVHTPICIGGLIWMTYQFSVHGTAPLPPIVLFSLVMGYGSGILIGAIGALRAGKPRLLLALPVMPLYWFCLFIPTYRAAYEYVKRPYYWAKTTHSATQTAAPEADVITAEREPALGNLEPNWPSGRTASPRKILMPASPSKSAPANDEIAAIAKWPKAAE